MRMRYEKKQFFTIFVVITTAFITTFTGSAMNLAIPTLGAEFQASAGTVGWIVTVYTLIVAAFSVPWGRLADLKGRKQILVMGLVVFTLSSLASIFAKSMWILIFCRGLQGIGASMIFSTNTALLISAFPETERGKVLGYSIAATYVGMSAGPVLGGVLNQQFSWRSIFIFTSIVSGIALLVAWKKLSTECEVNEKPKYDKQGAILYLGMILLSMYGLSSLGKGIFPILMIAFGVALGFLWVKHERKIAEPMVQVRLFQKNAAYTCANLAALMNYGATYAISYLLSIYLQVIVGYSSQGAGLVLIIHPLLMAVLSSATGKWSDRYAPEKLASVGMAFCTAGLMICIFLNQASGLWIVILALFVTGIGFALFSSPNTNAVMACVKETEYGVASSVLATMRSLGNTLSMAIVTAVTNYYMGFEPLQHAEPQTLIGTMRWAFGIYTAICLSGVFISMKRRKQ